MKRTVPAVGIDLGTTYSCISCLDKQGQPITLPNQEGELSTPSVVFFDEEEIVVGTEALRNAVIQPDRVIQFAKRHMGDVGFTWDIGGESVRPQDVTAIILRKLLSAAELRLGPVHEAVITVPAQFSEEARRATADAAISAGLRHIEMINEPVAAALCYVLGDEGLAFTELAADQQILVYDLGGGTLDLAIVRYRSDNVRVVVSGGDLQLGGLDWTQVLFRYAADRFLKETGEDPRLDPRSAQALLLEAEQAKRSLSVRPRAALTVQHAGRRESYQIDKTEFEELSAMLVERSEEVTQRLLKSSNKGWAHVDAVLTTGGASRMPMVKDSLQKMSGRTLNSALSPDQSIAHGAAYYAGMLLSNRDETRTVFAGTAADRLAKVRQQSVNARALGILVRDGETGDRVPHPIIPQNTALPAARAHVFGTVAENQRRVHVRIAESGTHPEAPWADVGECVISELPPGLPEGAEVEVTISYDRQARVHVRARELSSGRSTEVELVRPENLETRSLPPKKRAALPSEDGGKQSPGRQRKSPEGLQSGKAGSKSRPRKKSSGRSLNQDQRESLAELARLLPPEEEPPKSKTGKSAASEGDGGKLPPASRSEEDEFFSFIQEDKN